MARKKPRRKASVRTKRSVATLMTSRRKASGRAKRRVAALKAQDQFVRREPSHSGARSEGALMRADNPFGRVVGVYLELPLRLARCVTPFQVWAEQMWAGQRLLSAWQPR